MKKGWLLTIVAGTLALGITVGSAATSMRKQVEVDYSGIKIKVDGQVVDTANAEPFAVVSESRTYVPARYLAEALGGKVGWDQESRSVLVYTKKYVEQKTEGSITTFSLPYHGVTFAVPSGGVSESGTTNLIQVSYDDILVTLNRVDYVEALGMDNMTNVAVNSLKTIMPLVITERKQIALPGATAARDLVGAANTAPVRIRLIGQPPNLWMIMVIGNPNAHVSDEKLMSYLEGFKLPQQ